MICSWCKAGEHKVCPEIIRIHSYGGFDIPIELLGGQLCDCQHEPGTVLANVASVANGSTESGYPLSSPSPCLPE